jgi:hypothetical protein
VTTFEDIARLYEDLNPELTVFVEPHRVAELQAQVDAAGLPARVTVRSSLFVEPGQMIVSNETLLKRGLEDAARRPFSAWGEP